MVRETERRAHNDIGRYSIIGPSKQTLSSNEQGSEAGAANNLPPAQIQTCHRNGAW